MLLVIRFDPLQCFHRFGQRGKCQQTITRWKPGFKPGVLRHNRAATRKIMCAPLAKPATRTHHITVLCDGKLASGIAQVGLIGLAVHRWDKRVDHLPAVVAKALLGDLRTTDREFQLAGNL